jgi:hypothetical protein
MADDVSMRGRVLVWIAVAIAVAGLAGLGAYLAIAGLDKASAVAGVVVAFAELTSLALGVYGVTRERRSSAAGQIVTGTSVGGNLAQVRAVKGSVRIRHPPAGPAADAPPAPAPRASDSGILPHDGQSVTGSRIAGHVDQVDDVAGDVEMG